MINKTHLCERTSPKGEKFLGTCVQCGKTSMTLKEAMSTECVNNLKLSETEALIRAIKGY